MSLLVDLHRQPSSRRGVERGGDLALRMPPPADHVVTLQRLLEPPDTAGTPPKAVFHMVLLPRAHARRPRRAAMAPLPQSRSPHNHQAAVSERYGWVMASR